MSANLKTVLEAILFVAEAPLSLAQLTDLVDSHNKESVKAALAELAKEYDFTERSFTLSEVAGGYCLRTRPEMAYWLRRLRRQQVTRLSMAALETLAIVAYKQPVMKAEIERLRGVEVGGILRTLMNKTLIKVVGRKDLPGRPLIYGTTRRFLEVFDLVSLADLPTLEEMADLGDDLGGNEPSLFDALPEEARQAMMEQPETDDSEDGEEPDEQADDEGEETPETGDGEQSETGDSEGGYEPVDEGLEDPKGGDGEQAEDEPEDHEPAMEDPDPDQPESGPTPEPPDEPSAA